jgi:hypothetical protein
MALAVSVASSVGTAQALTLRAVCSHGAGSITADDNYETTAPFYIHIGQGADGFIAAHGGTFEGGPRFGNPGQVPCSVAESVAIESMTAWESWSGDTGVVRVSVLGATGLPYLGRFYCAGQSYEPSGNTYEACVHRGVHVGTIAVEFVIAPAPA